MPLSPTFAYYASAFGNKAPWFLHLLLKTAMTEFTIMSLVYFIQSAESGKAEIFMPACLRVLTNDDQLRAYEKMLVSLPIETRTDVRKRVLLRLISACTVDLLSAVLAVARAGEFNWAASDSVGCFLYDFADVAIISVLEWQIQSLKRGLRADTHLGVVLVRVMLRYINELRDAGMRC